MAKNKKRIYVNPRFKKYHKYFKDREKYHAPETVKELDFSFGEYSISVNKYGRYVVKYKNAIVLATNGYKTYTQAKEALESIPKASGENKVAQVEVAQVKKVLTPTGDLSLKICFDKNMERFVIKYTDDTLLCNAKGYGYKTVESAQKSVLYIRLLHNTGMPLPTPTLDVEVEGLEDFSEIEERKKQNDDIISEIETSGNLQAFTQKKHKPQKVVYSFKDMAKKGQNDCKLPSAFGDEDLTFDD